MESLESPRSCGDTFHGRHPFDKSALTFEHQFVRLAQSPYPPITVFRLGVMQSINRLPLIARSRF
jgi:hypothetical protein